MSREYNSQLDEPSFYLGTTQAIRRAGGDVLLECLHQYGLSVGYYSAASIASEIFAAMMRTRAQIAAARVWSFRLHYGRFAYISKSI
jgi:hypothetical protein